MKTLALSFTGLILAAGAAQAQPAEVPANDHAAPHADVAPADAAPPADAAVPATPAEPAMPATPARRSRPSRRPRPSQRRRRKPPLPPPIRP